MRVLAAAVVVLALWPQLAFADPGRLLARPQATARTDPDLARFHVGAATQWNPSRFADRVGLGLGWSVPQRWYDADGALLTERSLLHPGRDLERTGLYLALRF